MTKNNCRNKKQRIKITTMYSQALLYALLEDVNREAWLKNSGIINNPLP